MKSSIFFNVQKAGLHLNFLIFVILVFAFLSACTNKTNNETTMKVDEEIVQKANEFASFRLTSDLSILTGKEKEMLPLLFEVADIMEEIYWVEAFGEKDKLFEEGMTLSQSCGKQLDEAERKVEILLKKSDGSFSEQPFEPEDTESQDV